MPQAKDREPQTDRLILPRLAPAAKEAAFWLIAALAVVLAVALASFHPGDPSYTSTGTGGVRNLIGPAGAWSSDVLLFILGASAYALPLLVAYGGWLGFRGLARRGAGVRLVRVGALLLAIVALSTLLALVASPGPHWLPGGIGGVIGDAVATPIADGIGVAGAALVLLAVLLASITLATGLSWMVLMDRVGGIIFRIGEWLSLRVEKRREHRTSKLERAERSVAVTRERERRKTRVKPKIEPAVTAFALSPRAERERQKTLFTPAPVSGGLPSLELLDPPPTHDRGLQQGHAGGNVAAGGVEAARFRRGSRGGRGACRTGHYAL